MLDHKKYETEEVSKEREPTRISGLKLKLFPRQHQGKKPLKMYNPSIPEPIRDRALITRLIPILLVGADRGLDRQSGLYLRLLTRLVDSAYTNYINAKELLDEEIKTGDKLAYRFQIVGLLETSVNSISRVAKVVDTLINGKKGMPAKNLNLLNNIDLAILEKMESGKVVDVRNRVEHLDEDIYMESFQEGLFLDVDTGYENICINKKCISLKDLVALIETYHKLVIAIFESLPKS